MAELGVALLVVACGGQDSAEVSQIGPNEAPTAARTDQVLLRLRNDSAVAFDTIFVEWTREPVAFGALAQHAESAYREVGVAYSYGRVTATSGELNFLAQPIDYTGEQPLEAGRYTYELTVEAIDRQAQGQDIDGYIHIAFQVDSATSE